MNTVHTDLRGQNIGYNWITDVEGEITVIIRNENQLNTITWTTEEFKEFLDKSMSQFETVGV